MIAVRDLEFQYARSDFVLRIPILDVARQERVAITGPSGSGKTTLLNLIAGISEPSTGSIVTDGRSIGELSDRKRRAFRAGRIGLIFQEFELLDYLTVRDNILLPYFLTPVIQLTSEVRDRVHTLAETVEIGDKVDRKVGQLSQGERQRVALCRALLPKPAIVLADEPTGNLDPSNKQRVVDLLLESAESVGSTVLAVTHDHEVARRFDRGIDMRDLT